MRNITSKAIRAFEQGKSFRLDNTEVSASGDNRHLWLHGHNIARLGPDGLEINLCGWNTPTTLERLNGLEGVRLHSKQGQAFLNGNPIPSYGWVKVG